MTSPPLSSEVKKRTLRALESRRKEVISMKKLQTEIREKATNLGLEIRNILTPEQLAQLPAFSRDSAFGPGAGYGPGGFGPPMAMRGLFDRQ
jgi:hypothetical protein